MSNKIEQALRNFLVLHDSTENDPNNVETLYAFDMDGTLLDTHHPQHGREEWLRIYGEPWKHRAWWSRPETLTHLPIKGFQDIAKALTSAKLDPKGHTILITGRVDTQEMRNAILHAFEAAGIVPPAEMHLKQGNNSTEVWKGKRLKEVAARFPRLQEIHLWDDRDEHIPYFKSLNNNNHRDHPKAIIHVHHVKRT